MHEGAVKRRTDLPESVLKSLRRGRLFKEPGFLSTSQGDGFSGSVAFRITSLTGRSVAALSAFPGEAEVLFQSGAVFVITKRSTHRIGGKGGRPITEVVMEERHKIEDIGEAEGWLAHVRREGLAGYDRLADGELLAIRLYSQAGQTYRRLNRALRGGDAEPTVAAYRDLLDRALGRLPVYKDSNAKETIVRRGTDLPESVLKSLRRNYKFKESGFLSTSQGDGFSGSVAFRITSRTGRSIAALSEFPNEAEVLFQSGAVFDIIKRSTRRIGGKDGRPITEVVMEERHKIEDIGEAEGDAALEAERLRAWDRWSEKEYARLKPALDEDWAKLKMWEEPLTDWQRNFQAKGEGMFPPGSITPPKGWPPY